MGVLGRARRIVNRMLRPMGVVVQVLEHDRSTLSAYDLTAYEETERPEAPVYVNIGAGAFYHPYWHNLDRANDYYRVAQGDNVHIEYDLTSGEPLPIVADSLKVAYTSHVVEHIADDDVAHLFSEVHRCLRPGGVFRITCPDMDLEYDAFMRGDAAFWKWPNAYAVFNRTVAQCFLDHFATALTATHPCTTCLKLSDADVADVFASHRKEEAFDLIVAKLPKEIRSEYPGDHINWFNTAKLVRMLQHAGFSEVYESRYGQSRCHVLRDTQLFDSTCPALSLYVECRKSISGLS